MTVYDELSALLKMDILGIQNPNLTMPERQVIESRWAQHLMATYDTYDTVFIVPYLELFTQYLAHRGNIILWGERSIWEQHR